MGSGPISQRHGSADPGPLQNVFDPEHWFSFHALTLLLFSVALSLILLFHFFLVLSLLLFLPLKQKYNVLCNSSHLSIFSLVCICFLFLKYRIAGENLVGYQIIHISSLRGAIYSRFYYIMSRIYCSFYYFTTPR